MQIIRSEVRREILPPSVAEVLPQKLTNAVGRLSPAEIPEELRLPGVGKTTLLRAVTREAARDWRTVAVDTRGELAPSLDGSELRLDILSGYPRDVGLEIAVRCMAAQVAVCDEIGGAKDARAVLSAANHGVPLVATAHADTVAGLLRRADIRALHRAGVFGAYVGIERAKEAGFSYRITLQEEVRLDNA